MVELENPIEMSYEDLQALMSEIGPPRQVNEDLEFIERMELGWVGTVKNQALIIKYKKVLRALLIEINFSGDHNNPKMRISNKMFLVRPKIIETWEIIYPETSKESE